MTWGARVLEWLKESPGGLSSIDLERKYCVTHPRRVLGQLAADGLIAESHRSGNEIFWKPVDGKDLPADKRIERMKALQPMAVRARAMRRLADGAAGARTFGDLHNVASVAHENKVSRVGQRVSKRKRRQIRA